MVKEESRLCIAIMLLQRKPTDFGLTVSDHDHMVTHHDKPIAQVTVG
jgi:hypothetical protein